MKKPLIIIAVLISFSFFAGAAENNEEVDIRLEAARTLWEQHNFTEYSFTMKRGGVFTFSTSPKRRIRVEAGECIRVTYWRRLFRHEDTCKGRTIPDLFDELDETIRRDPESIQVMFHPEFGYPIDVSIEPGGDLTDQGWGYVISRFRH